MPKARPLIARKAQPVIERTFTTCMEQLHEGYVAAVAATAGCTIALVRKDVNGKDLLLVRGTENYEDDEVSVWAQLKCTTKIRVDPQKDQFSYPIKSRKYFEKLARRKPSIPAVLVVMTAPPAQAVWTEASHDHLEIRNACYWVSLEGETAEAGVESPTVHIPTGNIFDAKALTSIMDRLDRGEELR